MEVAREACEAYVVGDLDRMFEAMTPDFEWDTTHFEGWMEYPVVRGLDAVRRFIEQEWLAAWEKVEASYELMDADPNLVVLWSQRMTGRASRVPVVLDSAQVWTFRDLRVVRVENYTDRAEALEAAGLSA